VEVIALETANGPRKNFTSFQSHLTPEAPNLVNQLFLVGGWRRYWSLKWIWVPRVPLLHVGSLTSVLLGI